MAGYMRKKRQLKSEINVVPYIDVMLVLLIIFMVTSPFVTQGVEVDLPKTQISESAADMAEGSESSFIIIEIDGDGSLGVSVDDDEFVRDLTFGQAIEMVREAKEKSPDAPVAVGGDRTTPYEDIVLILDGLNQSGIEKVGLLTDIKE